MHVEAGTHPKLVQDRVGHSDIKLTMDVYGKLAGKMALQEQAARLDSMASDDVRSPWSTLGQQEQSKTGQNNENQPEARMAISA